MNDRTVRAIAFLCLFSAVALTIIGYHDKSWPVGVYGIGLTATNAVIIIYYQWKIRNRRT